MPDPPAVNLFTRFILENPWPLAIALGVIAAGAAWIGLRDGRRSPLQIAGVLLILSLIVLATGLLVTTPAEHGERVTRQLVDAAVAGDTTAAMALFGPNASFTTGSPRNPALDRSFIAGRLNSLPQYRIRSNRITSLKAYTKNADTAIVHLSCSTTPEGFGPVTSQWWLRIERQPDDEWLVERMTAIAIAGRTPSDRWW